MAGEEQPNTRRKIRFAPKAPPSRKPKPAIPRTEENEEDREVAQAQRLLGHFTEDQTRRRPKADKKSSVQVAYGPGAQTEPSMMTSGTLRDKNELRIQDSGRRSTSADDEQMADSPPSIANKATTYGTSPVRSTSKFKESYKEPWGDHQSNYPITLPWRPYSEDPKLLNEEEFGEAATSLEYDEGTINPASELGLLQEEQDEKKMFLFHFPPLPFLKPSCSSKGKEKVENVGSQSNSGASAKCGQVEDLSAGYMGKMLVYKSGAVKLKLGETLFDVTPSKCSFAQDAAAINTQEKQCCNLGQVEIRAQIQPDVHSIMDSFINLD